MPIFAQLTQSISNPATLSLGAISPVMTNLLVGAFLVVCIAMILLVLIQRPQGGGLSGAFGAGGGGGAGQTAFGTKTGDVLTWATIGIFIAFLGFAIVLNFATRPPSQSINTPVISAPAQSLPADDTQSDAGDGEAIDLSGLPDEGADEAIDSEAAQEGAQEADVELPAGTDLPAGDDAGDE